MSPGERRHESSRRLFDTDKMAANIRQAMRDVRGIEVRSVECPSEVPCEKGKTFRCKVTIDDDSVAMVEVTQQDNEGNQVQWRTVEELDNPSST